MLQENFWHDVNQKQAAYDNDRRRIVGEAAQALHTAKQAIFALHRDNLDEAAGKLSTAKAILVKLEQDNAGTPELRFEGSWGAAVEEWTEAALFDKFIRGQEVGEIQDLTILPNEYLSALSDYSGELLRRAVLKATSKDFDAVTVIAEEIAAVIKLLLGYNLSGVLRTKFDQAKRNQQKVEEIMYDISLR